MKLLQPSDLKLWASKSYSLGNDTASLAHANMNETSTLWCVAYEIADGLPLDADVGGEDVVPHLQRDGL